MHANLGLSDERLSFRFLQYYLAESEECRMGKGLLCDLPLSLIDYRYRSSLLAQSCSIIGCISYSLSCSYRSSWISSSCQSPTIPLLPSSTTTYTQSRTNPCYRTGEWRIGRSACSIEGSAQFSHLIGKGARLEREELEH